MNPFRRPPTVQECMARALPPEPEPVEQRVNDDGRTYFVVAYYPATATDSAAKVSYELAIGEVAERVRLSLLAGASRVECEPAWEFARAGAA